MPQGIVVADAEGEVADGVEPLATLLNTGLRSYCGIPICARARSISSGVILPSPVTVSPSFVCDPFSIGHAQLAATVMAAGRAFIGQTDYRPGK